MLKARRRETSDPATRERFRFSPAVAAWLLMNWFRASIALALLIVASSVGYYVLVTLPAARQQQMEQQLAVQHDLDFQRTRELLLRAAQNLDQTDCLASADRTYSENWENSCDTRHLGADCLLPPSIGDRWDEMRRNARSECLQRFPQH
jgi:hypothetical protein